MTNNAMMTETHAQTQTVASLLSEGRHLLRQQGGTSADLEAQILLCLSLSKPRVYVFSWPETIVPEAETWLYRSYLRWRVHGWPITYLTGQREFWSLPLQVNQHTLIPRHETETLVEAVLNRLPMEYKARIADIGCGCGAVSFAIAHSRPHCDILATDHCEKALQVARTNRKRLALKNVTLASGDWFEPLAGQRFDWIVSNPPYLAASDPHLTRGDLRFEPYHALVSDTEKGTDCLKLLIDQAPSFLTPDGVLAVEHGYDQGGTVRDFFSRHHYRDIETYQDLDRHERVTLGIAPSQHTS